MRARARVMYRRRVPTAHTLQSARRVEAGELWRAWTRGREAKGARLACSRKTREKRERELGQSLRRCCVAEGSFDSLPARRSTSRWAISGTGGLQQLRACWA